jgi:hypothetical protein
LPLFDCSPIADYQVRKGTRHSRDRPRVTPPPQNDLATVPTVAVRPGFAIPSRCPLCARAFPIGEATAFTIHYTRCVTDFLSFVERLFDFNNPQRRLEWQPQ